MFMLDSIDMDISAALLPVASPLALIFVAKKICVIFCFNKANKPSIYILSIYTTGSGLSVDCPGIGREKVDGGLFKTWMFSGEKLK